MPQDFNPNQQTPTTRQPRGKPTGLSIDMTNAEKHHRPVTLVPEGSIISLPKHRTRQEDFAADCIVTAEMMQTANCPKPKNVYVGSAGDAIRFQSLREKGITTILNAAAPECSSEDARHNGLTVLEIDLKDKSDEKISTYFKKATDFIDNADGNVLVHCKAGVSRSSTLVIAYMMKKFNMTLDEAIVNAQSKREKICPNIGFILELENLQAELTGKPVVNNKPLFLQHSFTSTSQATEQDFPHGDQKPNFGKPSPM